MTRPVVHAFEILTSWDNTRRSSLTTSLNRTSYGGCHRRIQLLRAGYNGAQPGRRLGTFRIQTSRAHQLDRGRFHISFGSKGLRKGHPRGVELALGPVMSRVACKKVLELGYRAWPVNLPKGRQSPLNDPPVSIRRSICIVASSTIIHDHRTGSHPSP